MAASRRHPAAGHGGDRRGGAGAHLVVSARGTSRYAVDPSLDSGRPRAPGWSDRQGVLQAGFLVRQSGVATISFDTPAVDRGLGCDQTDGCGSQRGPRLADGGAVPGSVAVLLGESLRAEHGADRLLDGL